MSASLQVDPLLERLNALTTATPTAGELRVRAEFWAIYADGLSSQQASELVAANIADLLQLADRMDSPAPVVQLVSVAKPKAKAKAITASLTAPAFWSLHSAACAAISRVHGEAWRGNAPEESINVTLPAKLCGHTTARGTRLKWNRDHRMPAAKWWPDGQLPAGVTATPVAPRYDGPMGDDYPSFVMIREAVSEQLMDNRIAKGRTAVWTYWKAQHGFSLLYNRREPNRTDRLHGLALAANCRRAFATEMDRLRRAAT